jgi:hypothetical protein
MPNPERYAVFMDLHGQDLCITLPINWDNYITDQQVEQAVFYLVLNDIVDTVFIDLTIQEVQHYAILFNDSLDPSISSGE